MKLLFAILVCIMSFSSSYAGLFEYTMGEKTRINTTKYESADIVESINVPSIRYVQSVNTFQNIPQFHTQSYMSSHSPIIFANDRYDNNHRYIDSYSNSDITKEMQYYISIANSIRSDIAKIRRYGGEYIPLRKQLERDLDDLEDQIEYLSDLRSELTRRNNFSYSSKYYNNNFRSQRLVDYYRKYGYEYDLYSSSFYYYDRDYGYYQRKPKWLNENLSPRDEGYIYIK